LGHRRPPGVPLYSDDGSKLIHLGGNYIHCFLDSDSEGNLRYRQRPEVHLAQRFVDTQDSAGVLGPEDIPTSPTGTSTAASRGT